MDIVSGNYFKLVGSIAGFNRQHFHYTFWENPQMYVSNQAVFLKFNENVKNIKHYSVQPKIYSLY